VQNEALHCSPPSCLNLQAFLKWIGSSSSNRIEKADQDPIYDDLRGIATAATVSDMNRRIRQMADKWFKTYPALKGWLEQHWFPCALQWAHCHRTG